MCKVCKERSPTYRDVHLKELTVLALPSMVILDCIISAMIFHLIDLLQMNINHNANQALVHG